MAGLADRSRDEESPGRDGVGDGAERARVCERASDTAVPQRAESVHARDEA